MNNIQNILDDIEIEVIRSKSKFPGNENKLAALTEETGELAQVLLQLQYEEASSHEDVYHEAIQVAAVAIRIALDGDSSFPKFHPESGYRGKNWEGYKYD